MNRTMAWIAWLAFTPASSTSALPPEKALEPGVYAVLDTSMGTITCELFEKLTPKTVAIFTGLAEGTHEWLTPKGDFVKRPFYDGLKFHRVVKGFMIQTGDVGANFTAIVPFRDEIVRSLRFDRPGLLAMANNGPHTNRTQFFITVAPAPHLNGKHTLFGRVVEGMEVVNRISEVRVLGQRPIEDVVVRKLEIRRVR